MNCDKFHHNEMMTFNWWKEGKSGNSGVRRKKKVRVRGCVCEREGSMPIVQSHVMCV